MAKHRLQVITISLLLPVMIVSLFIWVFVDLAHRPHWLLTARNSADGLVVEVHKSDASSPTYVAILKGHALAREFSRLDRQAFNRIGETTISFDETVKPGEWTVLLDGVRLQIMEARLVVNGDLELTPGQTAQIAK
jgi:hypothetical protein